MFIHLVCYGFINKRIKKLLLKKYHNKRKFWRRGIVIVASAYRTEDPGFESRQGVRFLRNLYIAVLLS
jgi:hypothetical protein